MYSTRTGTGLIRQDGTPYYFGVRRKRANLAPEISVRYNQVGGNPLRFTLTTGGSIAGAWKAYRQAVERLCRHADLQEADQQILHQLWPVFAKNYGLDRLPE